MTQEKVTAFNWKRFWEGAALGFAVPLLLLIALIGEAKRLCVPSSPASASERRDDAE